jgi:hypothetical protein
MSEAEIPWDGAEEVMKDIRDRWPVWVEMAKRNPGKLKTANSLILVALISYGMTTLLHSQVRSVDILRATAGIFDMSTNRGVLEEIWQLQRDRAEILGMLASLLMSQGDWLRQNLWPKASLPPVTPSEEPVNL